MRELYSFIDTKCKERGTNVTALCREANVPRSILSELKSGRTKRIGIEALGKISVALGVSMDELILLSITDEIADLSNRHDQLSSQLVRTNDEKVHSDLEKMITILEHKIANLHEMQSSLLKKKEASTSEGERRPVSDDGYHIGELYDRASEADQMLTHSVLDKYEEAGKITIIPTKDKYSGGMIEIDVYDEPTAAGFGNYLDAPKSHREHFPSFMVPQGADFGIRISGNSMEPRIADKNIVFVKGSITVDNGKVGIFVLNGEAFCKQLIIDKWKQQIRLHSFHPGYEDIVIKPSDDLRTIGTVL